MILRIGIQLIVVAILFYIISCKTTQYYKKYTPNEISDTLTTKENIYDTKIRNDGLPIDVQFIAESYGHALGGIKRWEENEHKHYQNNIFRFYFSISLAWKYYSIQDYNLKNCVLNIATPEIIDKDGNPLRNAVFLIASNIDSLKQDVEEEYNRMLNGMEKKSSKFNLEKLEELDSLCYKKTKYSLIHGVDEFVGEIIIIISGKFVYTINFNSTPDTYNKGRKYFKDFLKSAKWNI